MKKFPPSSALTLGESYANHSTPWTPSVCVRGYAVATQPVDLWENGGACLQPGAMTGG